MAASQTPEEGFSHLHSRSGRASGTLLLVRASWLQLLDVPRAPLGGRAGNEAITEGQGRCRRKGHLRASLSRVLGWGHGPLGPATSEVTAQKGSAAWVPLRRVGSGDGEPPITSAELPVRWPWACLEATHKTELTYLR